MDLSKVTSTRSVLYPWLVFLNTIRVERLCFLAMCLYMHILFCFCFGFDLRSTATASLNIVGSRWSTTSMQLLLVSCARPVQSCSEAFHQQVTVAQIALMFKTLQITQKVGFLKICSLPAHPFRVHSINT